MFLVPRHSPFTTHVLKSHSWPSPFTINGTISFVFTAHRQTKRTHSPIPCFFNNQFPEFLEYCDILSGKVLIMGDFNIHFETLNDHNSRKMHDISEIFSLSQSVTEPSHKHGHLLDLVFHRHNECLLRSTCLDHGLTSDHMAVLCQLDIPKAPLYQ